MEPSDTTEAMLDSNKHSDVLINASRKEMNGTTNQEDEIQEELEYDVEEYPPIFLIVTTAFQHTVLCVGSVVTIITVLSDIVCADLTDPVRARLFSSSVLIIGMSTAVQSMFGLRLPIFQGASSSFMIPLLAMKDSDAWKCPSDLTVGNSMNMTFDNGTDQASPNIVYNRLAELQGSLIAASAFELFIGATGMIGLLMRIISPIVIGVTVFCLGFSLYPIVIILSKAHWGISIIGCVITTLCSMYLSHVKIPLPSCGKKAAVRSKPFPFFQVFPVLITLGLMWIVCLICTKLGVFSTDSQDPSYRARTDVRNDIIRNTPWILIPYPGQFGTPGFNTAMFVGFFISVVTSVIESVGDYVATSRACHAYPVPRHAFNRGIAVEGLFSVLSGAYGTAHATTSYSSGVALVGLTKIASRVVLAAAGILAIILAIFGKFGAFMTSVPDPVLGGIALALLGLLCSLGISAFQSIDLRSSRNLSVIGFSIFVAIVFSEWQRQFPNSLRTDSDQLNQLVKVTLGNAMFIGFVASLVLDNTVRGTNKERGVQVHDDIEITEEGRSNLLNNRQKSRSYLFDLPLVSGLQRRCKFFRYVPFFQPYIVCNDITKE